MIDGSSPPVEIVVDELVLRGVPPEYGLAVASALQARLAAVGEEWAGSGGRLASRAEGFRRLPPVEPAIASPSALGEAVADALWGELRGGERR